MQCTQFSTEVKFTVKALGLRYALPIPLRDTVSITAFTLALRTVPARFCLSQHSYDRECKRVITVPCRAGPARVHIRGLARYGTVVAASVQ